MIFDIIRSHQLLSNFARRLFGGVLRDARTHACCPSLCVSFESTAICVLRNLILLSSNLLNLWHSVEILAFPFEHHAIDISSCRDDLIAYERKEGHKIHIMEAISINGPETHPVFKYLKNLFDMDEMDLSYAHYFFVDPDGTSIQLNHGVSYNAFKAFVDHHVKRLEL